MGVLLLAACAGAVTRDELDAERRARGGGISGALIAEAVSAAEAAGNDSAQLRSVSAAPGRVALELRIVSFGYRDGRLFGPTAVKESETGSPPSALFTLEEAGIERFDGMVDAAIADAELDGGYAVGAEIRQSAFGPLTEITVTDGDRDVSFLFTADGTAAEVEG